MDPFGTLVDGANGEGTMEKNSVRLKDLKYSGQLIGQRQYFHATLGR